ncbi:hypothetical protein [Aquimarina sp. 2201CG5-10]|uniref:hypothetical protein n=1 Tax=Aquimarina callyspongiae TaxID=3098150 RepID=UPI002AB45989|nr:hypothetical protein [Aquimarina sp. 2201CG5-10]MDY8135618.1 hypothetical protein [Aquimarina sp. 2201CG5-10]
MRTLQILITALFMVCVNMNYAQSEEKKTEESITPKENSSKETVTKIIRIKGPNGEEKVIKKEEVITKKNKIKLNPEDEGKTNQTAIYTDDEVVVQNSDSATSTTEGYSMVEDGKGYIITFTDKNGSKVAKARRLSNGYYIVNQGEKDNVIGHFDEEKNFIVEMYDTNTDQVISVTYKAN